MSQLELKNNSDLSAKYERFWTQRLADLQPLTIPYAKQTTGQAKPSVEIVKTVDDELRASLRKSFPDLKLADLLFAALMVYFARIGDTLCFDFGYVDSELRQQIANLDVLLAAYVPCRLEIDLKQNLAITVTLVREQVELAKQYQNLLDINTRHPVLDLVSGI